MSKFEEKITREEVRTISNKLKSRLSCVLTNIKVLGSYARGKDTSGDLDLYAELKQSKRFEKIYNKSINELIKELVSTYPDMEYKSGGNKHITLSFKHRVNTQIDLYMFEDNSYEAPATMFLTGSGKHNQMLRSIARKQGYKLSQYGLVDSDGYRLDQNTEWSIYNTLGYMYVLPQDRLDGSELKPVNFKTNRTLITSANGKDKYIVQNDTCTCKGFKYRRHCKHLAMAK